MDILNDSATYLHRITAFAFRGDEEAVKITLFNSATVLAVAHLAAGIFISGSVIATAFAVGMTLLGREIVDRSLGLSARMGVTTDSVGDSLAQGINALGKLADGAGFIKPEAEWRLGCYVIWYKNEEGDAAFMRFASRVNEWVGVAFKENPAAAKAALFNGATLSMVATFAAGIFSSHHVVGFCCLVAGNFILREIFEIGIRREETPPPKILERLPFGLKNPTYLYDMTGATEAFSESYQRLLDALEEEGGRWNRASERESAAEARGFRAESPEN